MPNFGRVTVTEQKKRRMVHLLSYAPEKMPLDFSTANGYLAAAVAAINGYALLVVEE